MGRRQSGCLGSSLRVFDFAELAAADVVNEAPDFDGFGDPRVSVEFFQLVADVFFDVLEGVEEGWGDRGGAGAVLDSGAQVLFGGVHQTAIGVVDDHELLGAKQVVRDDEGTQGVVGDDATGVANDVGVAGFQTEGANGEARIHAGQDGELARGSRRQGAEFVGTGVDFVGSEDFIDYGHGVDSVVGRTIFPELIVNLGLTPLFFVSVHSKRVSDPNSVSVHSTGVRFHRGARKISASTATCRRVSSIEREQSIW